MVEVDVLIIGAGVVGACIARELSRYKLKIALVEKGIDVACGTSKANSGIIHAGFESSNRTLKGQLCAKGNAMFDQLQAELNFPFRRVGELVVAKNDEELYTLRNLLRQGYENNVPDISILRGEQVLALEPNLSPDIIGALYAPSAGIICPYEFVFSLVENAQANGMRLFLDEKVIDISENNLEIITTKRKFQSRFVLNCAGLYADEIAEMAGVRDFKIIPRKGEEYLLDRRAGSLVKRIIFPPPSPKTKGILVIPTVEGTLMIGPTADEIPSKEDLSTTTAALERILINAQSIVPSISRKDIITAFAGLRPVADTEDFIIGPTKRKGFINVAGIQSPGLTSSPAIAKMVVEILKLEGLKLIPKKDFNPLRNAPTRITRLTESELNALIKKDPRYGRIVCRCEVVSEGEVVEAIQRGATTLDGIKFRTRAGMGRCQGGFCTFKTIEILAKHLHLPLNQITKKGGNSYILGEKTKG